MIRFNQGERHKYDDIIDLPHHVSKTRPQMPAEDRAAQFAPFAALTGHGEAVKETSRMTERRIEMDEDLKSVLDRKLWTIRRQLASRPFISVTYFVPDSQKAGGVYKKAAGHVKRLDEYKGVMFFDDGNQIPIAEIIELESQDISF